MAKPRKKVENPDQLPELHDSAGAILFKKAVESTPDKKPMYQDPRTKYYPQGTMVAVAWPRSENRDEIEYVGKVWNLKAASMGRYGDFDYDILRPDGTIDPRVSPARIHAADSPHFRQYMRMLEEEIKVKQSDLENRQRMLEAMSRGETYVPTYYRKDDHYSSHDIQRDTVGVVQNAARENVWCGRCLAEVEAGTRQWGKYQNLSMYKSETV